MQADVVVVKVERQAEQGGEQKELEEEDEALGPAVFAQVDGDVAHACGDAPLEDEPEGEDGPEGFAEVERGAGVLEGDGFGEGVGGEGVGGVVGARDGVGLGFGGGFGVREGDGGRGEGQQEQQSEENGAQTHDSVCMSWRAGANAGPAG